jgi:prepilin-type N-terminal cleavage/methylation domain-containing protein
MYKKFNRGFTLIELLVVIAIIGILSSVVLASLNTARGKGADAAIKSNINNMRAQAELSYDSNNQSYDKVCNATQDASIAKALNAIQAIGSQAGATTIDTAIAGVGSNIKVSCHSSAAGYAISAPLKSTANTYWCADSTGQSTSTLIALGSVTGGSIVCGS